MAGLTLRLFCQEVHQFERANEMRVLLGPPVIISVMLLIFYFFQSFLWCRSSVCRNQRLSFLVTRLLLKRDTLLVMDIIMLSGMIMLFHFFFQN